LEKLEESKIVNVVYRTSSIEAGLQAGKEQSFFKIYPNDVGLALSEAYAPTPSETLAHYKQVLEGKLRSNMGYLFETLLEEMLVSLSYNPFYSSWTEKDDKGTVFQYEVDFLIERYGKVQPLECKANAIGKASSLSRFEQKYRNTSRTGIVVTTKPLTKRDGRLWLPFYLIFTAFSKN
jgi:predicted AAA+ superfamily ATPase